MKLQKLKTKAVENKKTELSDYIAANKLLATYIEKESTYKTKLE
jgi:hypothetical protein